MLVVTSRCDSAGCQFGFADAAICSICRKPDSEEKSKLVNEENPCGGARHSWCSRS